MQPQPQGQVAVELNYCQAPQALHQRLGEGGQARANFHHRLAGQRRLVRGRHLGRRRGILAVGLRGTVDRLERTADGGLRVVDFKTNKRPITASAAASHEQLGVYQLAIEAGGFEAVAGPGAHSAGGALVFLRLAAGSDLDDYPREFHQAALREQPSLGEQDAGYPTWVHERLSRAVGLVREGRYPATPGTGCQWCPFQTSCPAKPSGRQVVA